jgi:hypothetical protein
MDDPPFRGEPAMPFLESTHPKPIPLTTHLRDLGARIAGSWLEPVLEEFRGELERKGILRVQPSFYLSTEWGVPFDTTAIAIPFYLASPDLIALHAEHAGHLEGATRQEILRYLRHEMGHVINYAYKLYEREDWTKVFGSIDQPYIEEYRPEPFSRRFVRHLPGWYAQKHPDEDWAETFAVWMSPGVDWQTEYANWPEARAKLEYCDRMLTELRDREPLVTDQTPDEAVDEATASLEEYFRGYTLDPAELPPGLDGSLRTIFEQEDAPKNAESPSPRHPASQLIRRLERELLANVYRWTGHFPERTRELLRRMAERADQLRQVYTEDRETETIVALTTLVTALAMNHVYYGTYAPQ